jgi:hypothetical protein
MAYGWSGNISDSSLPFKDDEIEVLLADPFDVKICLF